MPLLTRLSVPHNLSIDSRASRASRVSGSRALGSRALGSRVIGSVL